MAADEEAEELVDLAPDDAVLTDWVARRERGEPLAWITGRLEFCGRMILVDAGVYVPRAQSEELARRAAAVLPGRGRAADLCTGSGVLAASVAASVPRSRVVAVDIDVAAARCARANGVATVVGDLASPLPDDRFDVVMAVAPYVPRPALGSLPADVLRYEPMLALDGGEDGLAMVRRIVGDARRILRLGGWLLVELGGDQDALLAPTLAAHGFADTETWHDEDGDLRGLQARRRG